MTFTKTSLIRALRRVFPLLLLFMLVFSLQQGFTKYPSFVIKVEPGSVQERLLARSDTTSLFGDASEFVYFTVLSNIFFVLLIVADWTIGIKINKYLPVMSVVYLIITGVFFWTTLAPFYLWGQSPYFDFINIYEHLFVVLFGFFYYAKVKKLLYNWKVAVGAVLSLPSLYLVMCVIIYAASNGAVAVYPFLDFKNIFALDLNVGLSVFLVLLFIILFIAAFAFLAILVTRLTWRRTYYYVATKMGFLKN